jgi:hypothetical protein
LDGQSTTESARTAEREHSSTLFDDLRRRNSIDYA